ncbi:spore germination protein [Paenibacillus sp.]|uniref:spore germination protein n=1 Tax=Paenibacillus sp. TaxID=58172 RepID=UPI002811BF9F|nr:spore germination protein [Paenibacillus sp.]
MSNAPEPSEPLQPELDQTLRRIKETLGDSPDVTVRTFPAGREPHIRVAVVYMEGLTNQTFVNDFIERTLRLESVRFDPADAEARKRLYDEIVDNALSVGDSDSVADWDGMLRRLLSGEIVIFVDGYPSAIAGNVRGGERRGIAEPKTEVNVRGPKDSFNESLATNVSLIRRRLRSPNLWLETMGIGAVSETEVALMYLKGIAEDALVEEVRSRLNDIRIDAIIESGNVEELIQDRTLTPFPTVYNTERPDVVVGNLLEGRVAVLVDGTPNTLVLPTTISQFFKAAEDYYQRVEFAVFMRFIRYFSFFLLLVLPSVYIAVTTHHQEMIPTTLAINLLAQREGVPFPAFIEALIMEITFEIMREAGTRMPRAIGQAVSIVGAIVLGQAAVEAGIVTAMMVIIVALTGIASFATPGVTLSNSVRLVRFPLMVAAATFGFFGVIIAMILIVAHVTGLRSFGTPYFAPFAPFRLKHHKDALWRSTLKSMPARSRMSDAYENRPSAGGNGGDGREP